MTTQRAARLQTRKVHRLTRQAIGRQVRESLQGLLASEHQRLGDWAQEHFVLDGDSSHKRGRWEAWPFQLAILDWMGSDDIEELDVMKAKRVGYTKCLVASIAYDGAHRPRKQVVYQPVDGDRDDFVTSEVKPIFDIPAVGARGAQGRRRQSVDGPVSTQRGALPGWQQPARLSPHHGGCGQVR